MNGLRAVLSFRREERNRAIFAGFNDENAPGERRRAGRAGRVHTRRPAVRQPQPGRHDGDRRRAGHRRHPGGRRAGRVPAVRAPDVRPAGRAGDVLQHLPVGGRRAGEDLRPARGGPAVPGAGGPGGAAAAGAVAGESGSTAWRSPTPRRAGAAPVWTWTSRPGRPSPWSARPVRASRRWPSCWPGSTTRPPAGCCSTASTSARGGARPTCAAAW